jgi:hypothetical protein
VNKSSWDHQQDGFNNPHGLHTNAWAIHGAAQRQAAEFKLPQSAPSEVRYSGGDDSLWSTVKAVAGLATVLAALYGLFVIGTAAAALIYAVLGAVGGAAAGVIFHVAVKVLAFLFRVALFLAGAALALWVIASLFS